MSWNNYQFRNANEIDPLAILNQIHDFPDNAPIRLATGEVVGKNGGTISTIIYKPDSSHSSPSLGEHDLRELSEEEKEKNRSTLAQIKYDIGISYGDFGLTVANNFQFKFRSLFESGKQITKKEFVEFITKATDYPIGK